MVQQEELCGLWGDVGISTLLEDMAVRVMLPNLAAVSGWLRSAKERPKCQCRARCSHSRCSDLIVPLLV